MIHNLTWQIIAIRQNAYNNQLHPFVAPFSIVSVISRTQSFSAQGRLPKFMDIFSCARNAPTIIDVVSTTATESKGALVRVLRHLRKLQRTLLGAILATLT